MGLGIFLIVPLILIGGPVIRKCLDKVIPSNTPDYSNKPRHQIPLPQHTYGNDNV